jgi:hypothetical protein
MPDPAAIGKLFTSIVFHLGGMMTDCSGDAARLRLA